MTSPQYRRRHDTQFLHIEDHGYRRSLKPRQLRMIAIGGAIGSGLFLGTGKWLHHAGPGLFLVYTICAVMAFFVLRALGELVVYRPSSGSFVSYAREFFGEKAAFVTGWMYFLNWAMAAIVDTTAIARYFHYWTVFGSIPQWVFALGALLTALGINVISVKWFGEMEFWAAMVKVAALVAFLLFGAAFLLGGFHLRSGSPVGGHPGGLFPTGLFSLVMVVNGAVFAYAGIEMVGTAAGETANSEKVVPRAINSVIARLALFYVGSLVLFALLLPYTAYRDGTSPFVTFFSSIGFAGAGATMNVVVLTAAMSSLNAGLYSTGRILRSMAFNGSAPAFTGRISQSGVPYGGIMLTSFIALCGVVLNAWVPERAFQIGLNVASLGIIASWAMILLCQLRLWRLSTQGNVRRPAFRMFGAPYTGIITLVALAMVPILMAMDYPDGTWATSLLVVIGPALVIGWFATRRRALAIADKRRGYYGDFPAVAVPVLNTFETLDGSIIETPVLEAPIGELPIGELPVIDRPNPGAPQLPSRTHRLEP